jgi:Arc/MetJ-type ribon-helix-helix transcriptional regulator
MIEDRVLSHRLDADQNADIRRYPSMSEFVWRAINELMTREDEQRNRWWSRN